MDSQKNILYKGSQYEFFLSSNRFTPALKTRHTSIKTELQNRMICNHLVVRYSNNCVIDSAVYYLWIVISLHIDYLSTYKYFCLSTCKSLFHFVSPLTIIPTSVLNVNDNYTCAHSSHTIHLTHVTWQKCFYYKPQ